MSTVNTAEQVGNFSSDNNSAIERFQFHGDELDVVRHETRPCVVIRNISDALGLNHNSLLNRINRQAWAKRTVVMMTMVAADGKNREVACIDIRSLPMLLATVDASRVKLPMRSRVELYQSEAADALADHFLGPRSNDALRVVAAMSIRQERLETELHRIRQIVSNLDRPQGVVSPAEDAAIRAGINAIAAIRARLSKEERHPLAWYREVDNDLRAMVDFPTEAGAKWSALPVRLFGDVMSKIARLSAREKKRESRFAKSQQKRQAQRQASIFDIGKRGGK